MLSEDMSDISTPLTQAACQAIVTHGLIWAGKLGMLPLYCTALA